MHQRLLDSDSTVTDIGKSEFHEYHVLKRSLGESTEGIDYKRATSLIF